jgi:hypothetical protein
MKLEDMVKKLIRSKEPGISMFLRANKETEEIYVMMKCGIRTGSENEDENPDAKSALRCMTLLSLALIQECVEFAEKFTTSTPEQYIEMLMEAAKEYRSGRRYED